MTDNRTICLENGDPLGEDLLEYDPGTAEAGRTGREDYGC